MGTKSIKFLASILHSNCNTTKNTYINGQTEFLMCRQTLMWLIGLTTGDRENNVKYAHMYFVFVTQDMYVWLSRRYYISKSTSACVRTYFHSKCFKVLIFLESKGLDPRLATKFAQQTIQSLWLCSADFLKFSLFSRYSYNFP